MRSIPNGLLIAFEGIDGSGKTTTANRVADSLSADGYHAIYLREPTDGPHGRKLRELMVQPGQRNVDEEFNLFLLDRREDVERNISPVMKAGGIVCIDRYYISSMAYQGALGLDPMQIRQANEAFAPVPNLILHFNLPVETALGRIQASRAEGANTFEREDNLRRVAEIFDSMDFPQLVQIDASQHPDAVFEQVMKTIAPFVKPGA